MAWGIMVTAVMMFGMLGLAIFEVTSVHEISTEPGLERDAEKKEMKKAA